MRGNKLTINGVPLEYTAVDPANDDPARFKYLSEKEKREMAYFTEKLGDHTHLIREGDGLHLLQNRVEYHNQYSNYPPRAESFTVPSGKYFMMGDNRDNSKDSRWFGFVDRKLIVGRASAVAVSIDLNNYWLPRWSRFFSSLP